MKKIKKAHIPHQKKMGRPVQVTRAGGRPQAVII